MEVRRREEDFKNLVFANDLWPDERALMHYREMFKEEETAEESVEWTVPSDEAEIEEVLAAIAGRGSMTEPVEEHRV